jgi:hypothetical protein
MKEKHIVYFLKKYKSPVIITKNKDVFIIQECKKYELIGGYEIHIYENDFNNYIFIDFTDIQWIVSLERHNTYLEIKQKQYEQKKKWQEEKNNRIAETNRERILYDAYTTYHNMNEDRMWEGSLE